MIKSWRGCGAGRVGDIGRMNPCRFIVPKGKDTKILPTISKSLFSPLMFVVAQLVKNSPASAGDARNTGSIPGSGRSPGEGNGNPHQYSCLGNPWTEELGGLSSIKSQKVRQE